VHEFISKNDKSVEEIRKAMDENEAHSVRASQTLLVQLADVRNNRFPFVSAVLMFSLASIKPKRPSL
jgi:hypothetical protein